MMGTKVQARHSTYLTPDVLKPRGQALREDAKHCPSEVPGYLSVFQNTSYPGMQPPTLRVGAILGVFAVWLPSENNRPTVWV